MNFINLLQRLKYKWVTRKIPRLSYQTEELVNSGFYSQYGQDKFVFERLGNINQGVFFDIGAFDGITLSNSYYFEKNLGWSGIAIEPSPTSFEKLKKNRKCPVENVCISNSGGEVVFLQVNGSAAMLSGIVNKYDPKHTIRIDKELEQNGGTKKEIVIPCFTPTEAIRKYGFDHVDYLTIDTEGGELEILKCINFTELSIKIITVENNYSDTRIYDFMRTNGYELIAIMVSDEIYEVCRDNKI